MDSHFNGWAQVDWALSGNDDELRQTLLDRLVQPNKAYLRHGNTMQVGQQGWYSAVPTAQLAQRHAPAEPFPIPVECRTWHKLEIDGRDGLRFRFFDKQAWLYLAPPNRPSQLEFIIPYALLEGMLEQTEFLVADAHVSWRMVDRDRHARPRVIVDIPPLLFDYMQIAERVRLEIRCHSAGVPRLLHKDSLDSRRLSFAITYPRFIEV